jgi:hypothetical protein
MNQRVVIILIIAAALLAACDGGDPGISYAWCYTFDFTTSDYGATIINGGWVNGQGITTNEGGNLIQFNYTHTTAVNPSLIAVRLLRPSDDVTTDILSDSTIFGVPVDVNNGWPAGTGTTLELFFQPEASNQIGSTMTVEVDTSHPLAIQQIEIRGLNTESPFGSNPCGEGTPTTTPGIGTYTATPITPTETPTDTPTHTPTPSWSPTHTLTPIPTCSFQTIEMDFRVDDYGAVTVIPDYGTGVNWSSGTGFTNEFTTLPTPDGWYSYIEFNLNDLNIDTFAIQSLGYIISSSAYTGYYIQFANKSNNFNSLINVGAALGTFDYPATSIDIDEYTLNTVDRIRINWQSEFSQGEWRVLRLYGYVCPLTDEPTNTPTTTQTQSVTPTYTRTPVTRTATGTYRPSRTPVIVASSTYHASSTPINTPNHTLTLSPTLLPTTTLIPLPTWIGTQIPTPGPAPDDPWDSISDCEAEQTVDNDFLGVGTFLARFWNCVLLPPILNIQNAIGGFFNWVLNTGSNFLTWAGSLFGWASGTISNLFISLGNILQAFLSFFDLIFRFLGEVINIIGLLIAILLHILDLGAGWVSQITNSLQTILNTWYLAPPQPVPFLPQCATNPISSQVCAFYYLIKNTILAGTVGSLLIPVGLIVIDISIVFQFILKFRDLIKQVKEVAE